MRDRDGVEPVVRRLAKASGWDFQPRTVVSVLGKKIMGNVINAVGRSEKKT
jgi:hypothetical protein